MKYGLWYGTEGSLTTFAEKQKWAEENRMALIEKRQAYVESRGGDTAEDRIGDYLIRRQANNAASIRVTGSLTNAYEWWHEYMGGDVTSYEAISDALTTLANDDSVQKIVLDVSSGGGAVMGIEALSQKIRRVDARKPVIAYTETAAFSAAYWIAASAREVVATTMAEVGSIGTLMVHQSIAKAAEKQGVEFTVFRAGKFKALGLPYQDLSPEVKEHFQADIEKANSFFLTHVSLRRNLTLSTKGIWAEGKTFFAEEGQAVGLVDRISSMEELVSASSASTTRSQPMFISDEKRARIAAGAKPEDVLTAQELQMYQEELSKPLEAEEPAVEEGEGEEATPDVSAEEPAIEAPQGSFAEDYRNALRENGKLEARIDALNARNAELLEQLETRQAQVASLTEIGKLAVNHLQVALGKPKESAATAEGMVKMYNDLQTEMTLRFGQGRKSKGAGTEEASTSAALHPAFRNYRK